MIMSLLLATLFMHEATKTTERTYEMREPTARFFIVSYTYDTAYAVIPATIPPGKPHYSADITIYEVVKGVKTKLGETFAGQYVEGGCFEDDPESLVKAALGWKWTGLRYEEPSR